MPFLHFLRASALSVFKDQATMRTDGNVTYDGLSYAGGTDVGLVREDNEDAFAFFAPGGRALDAKGGIAPGEDLIAVVADGLGGHDGGEIASVTAVGAVGGLLAGLAESADPRDAEALRPRVAGGLAGVDRLLVETARNRGQESGMATTLTAAWFAGGRLVVLHLGDSRLYRLRKGKLAQLTVDDTETGRAVAAGEMTEAEARKTGSGHRLQRVLGAGADSLEFTLESHSVEAGDWYLLCSDGLTDGLDNGQIGRGLAGLEEDAAPEEAVERFTEAANRASGRDNVTIVLVRAGAQWCARPRTVPNHPGNSRSGMNRKQSLLVGSAMVGLLFLGALGWWNLASRIEEQQRNHFRELAVHRGEMARDLGDLTAGLAQLRKDLEVRIGGLASSLAERSKAARDGLDGLRSSVRAALSESREVARECTDRLEGTLAESAERFKRLVAETKRETNEEMQEAMRKEASDLKRRIDEGFQRMAIRFEELDGMEADLAAMQVRLAGFEERLLEWKDEMAAERRAKIPAQEATRSSPIVPTEDSRGPGNSILDHPGVDSGKDSESSAGDP